MEKVLPVEVVLRDLAGWAERTPEPYTLWITGIKAALEELKEKDKRWQDEMDQAGKAALRMSKKIRLQEKKIKELRDLLYRWMSTQEDQESVDDELLEATDKAINEEEVRGE